MKTKMQRTISSWLWFLGWFFMFPLPLTILAGKKQGIHPRLRWFIVIGAWLTYVFLFYWGITNHWHVA